MDINEDKLKKYGYDGQDEEILEHDDSKVDQP